MNICNHDNNNSIRNSCVNIEIADSNILHFNRHGSNECSKQYVVNIDSDSNSPQENIQINNNECKVHVDTEDSNVSDSNNISSNNNILHRNNSSNSSSNDSIEVAIEKRIDSTGSSNEKNNIVVIENSTEPCDNKESGNNSEDSNSLKNESSNSESKKDNKNRKMVITAVDSLDKLALVDEVIVNGYKFVKPRHPMPNNYNDNLNNSYLEVLRDFIQSHSDPSEELIKYYDTQVHEYRNRKMQHNMKMAEINNIQTKLESQELTYIDVLNKNNEMFRCLLDTGSTHSVITEECYNKFFHDYNMEPIKMTMSTAAATDTNNIIGKADLTYFIQDVNYKKIEFQSTFLVAKNLNDNKAILGANILNNKFITVNLSPITWQVFDDQVVKTIFLKKDANCWAIFTAADSLIRPGSNTLEVNVHGIIKNNISCEQLTSTFNKNLTIDKLNGINSGSQQLVVTNICKKLLLLPKDTILFLEEYQVFNDSDPTSYCHNTKYENIESLYESFANNSNEQIYDCNIEETIENSYDVFPSNSDEFNNLYDIQNVPKNLKKDVQSLLDIFGDIFSNSPLDVGLCPLFQVELEFDEAVMGIEKQRQLSHEKAIALENLVSELREAGIVEEYDNHTPRHISNPLLVEKPSSKNNTQKIELLDNPTKQYRLTMDARKLNLGLKNRTYTQTLPIEKIILGLKNKIVTSLDIKHGFFNFGLSPNTKRYFAFWVNSKVYTYTRLIQGLSASPSIMIHAMNLIFSRETMLYIKKAYLPDHVSKKLPDEFNFIYHYVDDVFIHSSDEVTHFYHLYATFAAIHFANLRIQPSKCRLFAQSLKVLGMTVNPRLGLISLDEKRAQSILSWTPCTSLHDVQSKLHSLKYFSRHIPNLCEISYPLISMLRKNKFQWGPLEHKSFRLIKSMILAHIKTTIPSEEDQLVLTVDSSKIAISAILFLQKNNEKTLIPVGFFSKLFTLNDFNRSIYIKETFSLIEALRHFRTYILNSKKPLRIFTDARSLIYIGRSRHISVSSNAVANKLSQLFAEMRCIIYHIPGRFNVLADILSRSYLTSDYTKGTFSISKSQILDLPILPKKFFINSKNLKNYLTSQLSEKNIDGPSQEVNIQRGYVDLEDLNDFFEKNGYMNADCASIVEETFLKSNKLKKSERSSILIEPP